MSRAAFFAITCCTHIFGAASGIYSPETALDLSVGAGVALFGHWLVSRPHPRDQITKERT